MSELKSTGNEIWSNIGNFALRRKCSNTYCGEWLECLQDQKGKFDSEKRYYPERLEVSKQDWRQKLKMVHWEHIMSDTLGHASTERLPNSNHSIPAEEAEEIFSSSNSSFTINYSHESYTNWSPQGICTVTSDAFKRDIIMPIKHQQFYSFDLHFITPF